MHEAMLKIDIGSAMIDVKELSCKQLQSNLPFLQINDLLLMPARQSGARSNLNSANSTIAR